MKIFISLLFLLKLSSAFAQEDIIVLNNSDSAKMIRNFLAGSWQEDSALNRVQFITTGNQLRLTNTGSYVYEFFRTNSYPLDGVSITWPPHGCLVKKINENYIEVTYTLFGGEPMRVKYKKVNSL